MVQILEQHGLQNDHFVRKFQIDKHFVSFFSVCLFYIYIYMCFVVTHCDLTYTRIKITYKKL